MAQQTKTSTLTTILAQIVAEKHASVAVAKGYLPYKELAKLSEKYARRRGKNGAQRLRSLRAALTEPTGVGKFKRQKLQPKIIAEIKRASPLKGVLRPELKPYEWSYTALAQAYTQGGAAALSVLTDVTYFWGNPAALALCRQVSPLPLLRKDFIVDVYQVDESRLLGADAILLIAKILERATLKKCAQRAFALGLEVLIEVHDPAELAKALEVKEALIGVNQRDLTTMQIAPLQTLQLLEQIPKDRLVVIESGIAQPADLLPFMDHGVTAFLIGEQLAKQAEVRAELQAFRNLTRPPEQATRAAKGRVNTRT